MDSDFCTVCSNYSADRDDENFIIGTNPIIYCSVCNIGVHLKCVGLAEIPERFICDKCVFLSKGGDPDLLTCAFCPSRYGYLFACKRPLDEDMVFCHLSCALFSNGGKITNFCKVVINKPVLNVTYMGSPAVPTVSFSNYSVALLPPLPNHIPHSRPANRANRNVSASLSMRVFRSMNLDYSAITINYKSEGHSTLFSSFRNDGLVDLDRRCKLHDSSHKSLFPAIRSTVHHPSSTNGRFDCIMNAVNTGGLCMICRIPSGITHQCSKPGCTCSFHLTCLWAIGGSIQLQESHRFYVDRGVSPSIEAFCLTHQPVVFE